MNLRLALPLAIALAFVAACGPTTFGRPAAPRAAGAVGALGIEAPVVETMLSPHFDDRDGKAITAIVLHHTAMVEDAKAVARFFQRKDVKASAHYIVDRDGSIVRSVPDADRAWHAGRSTFQGEGDVNDFSIGIEICNVGDSVEPYPEAQVQAVVKLVAWLAKTYKVPMTRLTRHRDVAVPAGRKKDTSDNFDQAYVAKAAQALLDGEPPAAYRTRPAPAGYDPSRQTHVVRAAAS